MAEKLYNSKYMIGFYEKDDDTLYCLVSNIREACIFFGYEPNHNNLNMMQVNIFRALRRPNHQCNIIRGRCLKVHLIDMTEEDD